MEETTVQEEEISDIEEVKDEENPQLRAVYFNAEEGSTLVIEIPQGTNIKYVKSRIYGLEGAMKKEKDGFIRKRNLYTIQLALDLLETKLASTGNVIPDTGYVIHVLKDINTGYHSEIFKPRTEVKIFRLVMGNTPIVREYESVQ